ncbi:hypothetical protein GWO43_28745, partial [candidate division KSB1 bacterium]|nr:hypothetical protein [candidate division KSB1 bacterium]NIR71084.1 hypothetical protein [candidate division KSB1 bacterium]NIS27894.1 hypothetical protein [candidate division KSB1 bacterium]NIT74777.1 hypothetical protein [candidate division KSB1 bacterium]NIU28554.1 hypothetical protein [candidate division KSB1 bacterium]
TAKEAQQVARLTPEERLGNIRTNLKEIKMELAKDGKYNCCTQPTCDWCALHEGECPCHDNLNVGKEVCPGCGLGWHNGNGVVEGVETSQVKWNITHQHAAGGHSH